MTTLRVVRLGAWAVVAIALVAIIVFGISRYLDQRQGGAVTIGGPFALTSQAGEPVTEKSLHGHPSLVYFGYTFCPDVCPTTLFEATNWLKTLGPDGDRLKFYFVTVDPERDTEKVLASYLSAFDPRIVGLTGTPAAIESMLKAYKVYARKVSDDKGGYTMDHVSGVYMLDELGRFAGVIAYQEPTDTVIAKLRKLIGKS